MTDAGTTLCPFALITGTACPLCGMTRAIVHLAQGDLAAAVAYHPLVLLVVLAVVVVLVTKGRQWLAPRRLPAALAVAGLFLVTWVVRLATGTLPPV